LDTVFSNLTFFHNPGFKNRPEPTSALDLFIICMLCGRGKIDSTIALKKNDNALNNNNRYTDVFLHLHNFNNLRAANSLPALALYTHFFVFI
jgi:hypothetical protein